jgi:hypothetical protein
MLEHGMYVLSRGVMMTWVMGGSAMLSFFSLALTTVEQQDNLREWVDSG